MALKDSILTDTQCLCSGVSYFFLRRLQKEKENDHERRDLFLLDRTLWDLPIAYASKTRDRTTILEGQ